MKVLLASPFHPELMRGGAQQVAHELFHGLRARPGIEPILLAAAEDDRGGIGGFDGRPGEYLFRTRDYDPWWHKAGDPALVEAYAEFLRIQAPDVVHFHHFVNLGIDLLTLTRGVLPAARIVFTFHEFHAICAADGHMVRTTDRSLCRMASPVRCHQCHPARGPEDFVARKLWLARHLEVVDRFTCPSRFMIEPYVEWGIARDRIAWVTNGQANLATSVPPQRSGARNRFGFFGQLTDDKGIGVLLRAVELLRHEGFTGFSVDINGDNLSFASDQLRREVAGFLDAEAARPAGERLVHLNGPYELAGLDRRMAEVDWCIVPSTWWEIFGLVVSEAWMFGKPVICSDAGGLAERVRDGIDGLVFPMGSARALAETIKRAATEEGLWQRLHEALPVPPSREAMVEGMLAVYRT